MTQNPLEKLYRYKTFYTSLPSGGRFYPSGIRLSADKEIGIMPMSATDEIKLKTPDSLFNGEALYDLFRSCIPDIENPKEIPICDVDKLLIGIRVASQGKQIDIKSECPKCKRDETYAVDLTAIMASAKEITQDTVIDLGNGVQVELKPLTLQNQIMSQIESFYHYRMQQMVLDNKDTDEEAKAKIFDEALIQAIALQVAQMADAVVEVRIKSEDETVVVNNHQHIFEWVENMDSATSKKIKKKLEELNDPKIDDKFSITCTNPECGHSYKVSVDLNPVNFF